MSTLLTVLPVLVLLVVTVALIVGLWRKKATSKVDWLLTAVLTAAFVTYVTLAGRWDASSYYLRPIVVLAFLAALVVSLIRLRGVPWWSRPTQRRDWFGLVGNAVVALVFLALCGATLGGVAPRTPTANLVMPLRDGVSYVGHGGASTWLNYHHVSRAQAYAVDIVGLNAAGRTSSGLHPGDPTAYAIFGRTVYSPCSGAVIEARGDLADQRPPATDTENLAGNHVVIRCADSDPAVDVVLAHLQQNSVAVRAGDTVTAGQQLARVGNTGNTSEPHLHVHAIATGSGSALDGVGVPVRFDDRFLLRNDLVIGTDG